VLRAAYLGISFDPIRLAHETGIAANLGWEPHFNRQDYQGEWSGIALRSNSPHARRKLYIHGDDSPFRDTDIFSEMPYFRECINSLPFETRAVRILKLAPGAVIREHRDIQISIDYAEARFHIPITTNNATEFVVADLPLVFVPGECWYINVDLPHRIVNRGASDRIHLIVDAVVTPSLREAVLKAPRCY
jgi:hypothetical protein